MKVKNLNLAEDMQLALQFLNNLRSTSASAAQSMLEQLRSSPDALQFITLIRDGQSRVDVADYDTQFSTWDPKEEEPSAEKESSTFRA